MEISTQTSNSKLLELIGAIILSTQEAEKYLKVIIPFTDAQDSSIRAALLRYEKIKKRTFGELVGKLVDSATSKSDGFEQHLAQLVYHRNQIVHHFGETYGGQLRSGQAQQVIDSLRSLRASIDVFRKALAQLALHLYEAMRDTTFYGTPEYDDMKNLCALLRGRVPS